MAAAVRSLLIVQASCGQELRLLGQLGLQRRRQLSSFVQRRRSRIRAGRDSSDARGCDEGE